MATVKELVEQRDQYTVADREWHILQAEIEDLERENFVFKPMPVPDDWDDNWDADAWDDL